MSDSSSNNKEGPLRTILVAFVLCLVCSILVSWATVSLRPLQKINKELDIKSNILNAAGLLSEDTDVSNVFDQMITTKVIDFETGEYTEKIDPADFDQRKASSDPNTRVDIPAELDVGGIKTRAPYGLVYFVEKDGQRETLILPVKAKGLWSMMYGFIAIDTDDYSTIRGFSFYEHGETPGLGAEVENPRWASSWKGKKIYDPETGEVKAAVAKGKVSGNPYKVDGLSGATITSNGITNMFRYWFNDHGYGKFLDRLKKQENVAVMLDDSIKVVRSYE